jgi:hypothetical protein
MDPKYVKETKNIKIISWPSVNNPFFQKMEDHDRDCVGVAQSQIARTLKTKGVYT